MTDQTDRLNTALAGRYRIERPLGEGGMATVYLCDDLKHGRKVALKLLKPELAAVLGAERFVVEIKTTAALQHPHILPLFDSGSADGFLFYVMPFIDGETLRDRLNRETQLGVDEAVRIARDVADALDYAHRHGVIHRDIKPENILLHDGRPMVADFGIALAVSAAAGGRMTETGLSLGTPHYMSPEQATAEKEITARSDVYSLGSVLYEMLTGNPPFVGAAAQQIIMKIITEPAEPVTKYRKAVPANVAAAVAMSLEKLPADRFENAKAFADALMNPAFGHESGGATGGRSASWSTAAVVSRRAFWTAVVTAVVAVAIAVMSIVAAITSRNETAGLVVRASLDVPPDVSSSDATPGPNVVLSPNGDRIAAWFFRKKGGASLYLRATDQLDWREIAVAAVGIRTPCFSPDGNWIAFAAGNDVVRVSVDGGPLVKLATLPQGPRGLTWGPKGLLVSGTVGGGLYVISERGGEPRYIANAPDERRDLWPAFLPGGDAVVYLADGAGKTARHLAIVNINDGARTRLDFGDAAPIGFVGGRLVYTTSAGTLMAVAFDVAHRRTAGPAIPVAQDVIMDTEGGARANLSTSGSLVMRSGKTETQPMLVRRGLTTALTTDIRSYSTPRVSPDGRKIAFSIQGPSTDVWVFDRERGTLSRVTDAGDALRPEWYPDSKRLIFVSGRGGKSAIWAEYVDGSAQAELVYAPADGDAWEGVISPDAKWLVYRTGPGGQNGQNIFAIPLDGKGKPTLLVTGAVTLKPRLSPDGHWLAYQSSESGQAEIYVRPFPGSGGRVLVSAGGGSDPIWAPSGRTLYYTTPTGVLAVQVTTGASFGVGARTVAVEGAYEQTPSHPNFDVLPDGDGFLLLRRAGEDAKTVLIHNWVRELVTRTAAAR